MCTRTLQYFIASFLSLLLGFRLVHPQKTSALPYQESGGTGALIQPLILSDEPIQKVVYIRSGDLAFSRGSFQNGARELVAVKGERSVPIATAGDPVPGNAGLFLGAVGITDSRISWGDFSLNEAGEAAFVANIVPCDSQANIAQCAASVPDSSQRQGLFLFSERNRITVALQGDAIPGFTAGNFRSFDRVLLNNKSMIAFAANVTRPNGYYELGLFSYVQGHREKIVIGDEPTSLGQVTPEPFRGFLLNDDGVVTFRAYYGIFRYQNGLLATLSTNSALSLDANSSGDVVFQSDGLYLRPNNGEPIRIVANGDAAPNGGQFVLLNHNSIDPVALLLPEINDSGSVLFASATTVAEGLFLFTHGQMSRIAADGDSIPGIGDTISLQRSVVPKYAFALNNANRVAFSDSAQGSALYYSADGNLTRVAAFRDSAPGTGGEQFKSFSEFSVADSGNVGFHADLCCGMLTEGIFRAIPLLPRIEVPNAGFENGPVEGRLPGWTTTWRNSGTGGVWQYGSGGQDSFEGNSVLRLHVDPGGGAIFVLSDPIPIAPGSVFELTSEMRYALNSRSKGAYFSVIQFDSAGNAVGFDQTVGTSGDNAWKWVGKALVIHSTPNAASIRIRFGLVSVDESYLDVDAVY